MASTHEVPNKFLDLARTVKNPIIADIGSRDATEGLYLFDALNANKLYVFEPNPKAANLCRKNIADHGDENNIFFNEIAFSNTPGKVEFYPVDPTSSERDDIGLSSMLKVNPKYTNRRGNIVQEKIIVTATTADDYFIESEKPNILWIDVEGAELMVLEGARNTLDHVELIHIEVSFRPMHIGKPLFWEIDKYLFNCGFKLDCFIDVSPLKSFLARHHLLPNPPWRWNAIYVKQR